jgi:hypothetical protein
MKLLSRTRKTGAVLAFGFVALALGDQSDAKPAKTKIYKVDEVNLSVSGANKIKVSAKGTVRTGGWTAGELIPSSIRSDKKADADTITLNFDFVATKPTGGATTALESIKAETTCPAPGAGKKLTVVIHAETNKADDSIQSPHRGP